MDRPLIFEQIPLWQDVPAANDPVYDTPLFHKALVDRELPGTLEEKTLYRVLMRRQRGRCGSCSRHWRMIGKLEKDHRCALQNGGDNSMSNQWLLCSQCHALKTSMDKMLHVRLMRSPPTSAAPLQRPARR